MLTLHFSSYLEPVFTNDWVVVRSVKSKKEILSGPVSTQWESHNKLDHGVYISNNFISTHTRYKHGQSLIKIYRNS